MDRILENIKNIAPLMALIAAYSIFAFYNLGNMDSPQTAWTSENAVIVDFGEVRHISRFQFMVGARHDVPFMLFASLDGEYWHFSRQINGASVFAWQEENIDTQAKYAQIVPFGPGVRLQEAAFRDHNDWIISPVHILTPEGYALFDEQDLVPRVGSFMNSTYFDEIYHARTGYEFLHGLRVFETTHPPMGKNLIALGIRAFGMTPFGWRLPGTLAGILMIPLMYIFGWLMFNKEHKWGLFCAFIFAFDFMTFAQTRIATIDSFTVLFILASYLCMYAYVRDREIDRTPLPQALLYLAGSGIFIGLAVATKWQGLYAMMGLPFLFFPTLWSVYKRNSKEAIITFAYCFAFFIATPAAIYLLSYIPFVRIMDTGDGFLATVIANQQHMFSYHSELMDGHPFSSRWWEWPLITRPIFYYANTISPEVRQGISSFGNPAVWWFGIFATFSAFHALRDKDKTVIFLLISYVAQFLPWVFVYRATFIYHYFPSVPFVVLLIVYFFKTKYPKYMLAYGVLVLGLFFLFYPVLSAAPVSFSFVENFLRWLPAWVLV